MKRSAIGVLTSALIISLVTLWVGRLWGQCPGYADACIGEEGSSGSGGGGKICIGWFCIGWIDAGTGPAGGGGQGGGGNGGGGFSPRPPPAPGQGRHPEEFWSPPSQDEIRPNDRLNQSIMNEDSKYVCGGSESGPVCSAPSRRITNTQGNSPARQAAKVQSGTEPVSDSGEFVVEDTDITFPFYDVPFVFTRSYRSGVDDCTAVGCGWSHIYHQHVVEIKKTMVAGPSACATDYPDVFYLDGRLSRILFVFDSVEGQIVTYKSPAGLSLKLTKNMADKVRPWTLDDGSGILLRFDATWGDLVTIESSTGHHQEIEWIHPEPKTARKYLFTVKWGDPNQYGSWGNSVTEEEDTTWEDPNGYVVSVADSERHRTVYFGYQLAGDKDLTYRSLQCLSLQGKEETVSLEGRPEKVMMGDCNTPLVQYRIGKPYFRRRSELTSYRYSVTPIYAEHCRPVNEITDCTLGQDWNGNPKKVCPKDPICEPGQPGRDEVIAHRDNGWIFNYTNYVQVRGFDLEQSVRGVQSAVYSYDHRYDETTVPTYRTSQYLTEECNRLFGNKDLDCRNADLCAVAREAYLREGCGPVDPRLRNDPAYGYCMRNSWNGDEGDDFVETDHDCRTNTESWRQRCIENLTQQAEGFYPLALCRSDQLDKCLANGEAVGRHAFGLLSDLRHNLIKITDGDGRVVVANTYGEDPFESDFDKVKIHVQGNVEGSPSDATMRMEYYDLAVDPGPFGGFDAIEICPASEEGGGYNAAGPSSGDIDSGTHAVQEPAYAVVTHDIEKKTDQNVGLPLKRTTYFDASWNRLREIREDGSQINYNYKNDYVVAIQDQAGRRVCIERDDNGRPLKITELPSPGYQPASPVVSEMTYDDAGQLIQVTRDSGGLSPSGTQIIRDRYERVIAMGEAVSETKTDWTCYQYDRRYSQPGTQRAVFTGSTGGGAKIGFFSQKPVQPTFDDLSPAPANPSLFGKFVDRVKSILPGNQMTKEVSGRSSSSDRMVGGLTTAGAGPEFERNGCAKNLAQLPGKRGAAVDVVPQAIIRPDGSVQAQSKLGPNGSEEIVHDSFGPDPRELYFIYDEMGRVKETGRGKAAGPLAGSRVQWEYDGAGQIKISRQQDPNNGNWIETTFDYDRSGNLIKTVGPEVQRDIVVSELGIIQSIEEIPLVNVHAARDNLETSPKDRRSNLLISNAFAAGGRNQRLRSVGLWNLLKGRVSQNIKRRQVKQDQAIGFMSPSQSTMMEAARQLPPPPSPSMEAAQYFPKRRITTFLRDILDVLHDVTPPEGNTTHYEYDAVGRLTSAARWNDQTRSMEKVASYRYDKGGFLESETVNGRPVSYVRDGFGRPVLTVATREILGFGNMGGGLLTTDAFIARGFDSHGRVTWEAVYHSRPSLAKPNAPDKTMESMTEYSYDMASRITSVRRWKFKEGVWDSDKYAVTKFEYDSSTNAVKTTDPEGKVMVTRADPLGRLLYQSLADGTGDQLVTDYSYAPGDQVTVTSTIPPTNKVLYYNSQGALAKVAIDGKAVLSRGYDSLGRLVSLQAEGLGGHSYQWDPFGNLILETQETESNAKSLTSYGYDLNGRRTFVRDAANHSTTYRYDGLDRLVKVTNGLGSTVYTYDPNIPGTDRVRTITDPSGTTKTFGYFLDGLVQSEEVVDGAGLTTKGSKTKRLYDYTAAGQLKKAILVSGGANGRDMTVSMTYDSLGRKLAEYNDMMPVGILREYEKGGMKTAVTEGDPSLNKRLAWEEIRYDNLYRATSVKAATDSRDLEIAHFQYQNGLLQSKTLGNQTSETYSYHTRGWPESVQVTRGNQPIAGVSDWLGVDGAPRARTRQLNGRSSTVDYYKTDLVLRLTAENLLQPVPGQPFEGEATNDLVEGLMNQGAAYRNYTLDGVANWLTRSGTDPLTPGLPDTANRYPSMDGNPLNYDHAGNLLIGLNENYAFNGLGKLITAANGSGTMQYTYDPLGRRLTETDGKTKNLFVWDGGQMVAYGPPGEGDPTALRMIVGGSGRPLALVDKLGNGASWYLHAGTDGSTLAVTDAQGNFVEGYSYSGFGETTFWDSDGKSSKLSTTGIDNRFLFQGQWFNPATGLYTMGLREYKPAWGRWLSPDPIGVAGGANLYAFVGGKPLSYADPSGLCASGKSGSRLEGLRYTRDEDRASPEWLLFSDIVGSLVEGIVSPLGGNPANAPGSGTAALHEPKSLGAAAVDYALMGAGVGVAKSGVVGNAFKSVFGDAFRALGRGVRGAIGRAGAGGEEMLATQVNPFAHVDALTDYSLVAAEEAMAKIPARAVANVETLLGKTIGRGQQGTVYELAGDPSRVIKVYRGGSARGQISGLEMDARNIAERGLGGRIEAVRTLEYGVDAQGRAFTIHPKIEGTPLSQAPAELLDLLRVIRADRIESSAAAGMNPETVLRIGLRNNIIRTPSGKYVIIDPI